MTLNEETNKVSLSVGNWIGLISMVVSVEACYSFLVMKLSFLVSEILMELQRADDRWYGEELTERFKHLQQAGEDEDAAAFSLSAEVFCELLEDMTQAHPGLVPRLADLQSRLWEQIRKLDSKRMR